jgi:hypothetical protein
MRTKGLAAVFVFLAAVLFSYNNANAQVPEKPADTTTPAAEPAKNPRVIVTDNLQTAADKAKADVAKPTVASTKTFGNHAVTVTEGVQGEPVKEGGRWLTTSTWDGTKWVSKRTWFPDKAKP